jgi:uncharacterized protein YkwD
MFVGGLQFAAGGGVGGQQATTPISLRPTTVAAAAGGGAVAAPAPQAASGVAPQRRSALAQGALPTNAAEREWVQRYEGAMRTTVGAVQALAGEAVRQARLGRDVHGRPIQRSEDHAYEQRVLDLVNRERARYGLAPLAYERRLDTAAERHNQQQVATRMMAHAGIGDGTPGDRVRAAGWNGAWGENVATGQLSPEQVVAEWMASPGHRRNILDPNFRHLGVAYSVASDGRSYWTQKFGA